MPASARDRGEHPGARSSRATRRMTSTSARPTRPHAIAAPARVASLVLLAPALADMAPSAELQAFAEAEDRAIDMRRADLDPPVSARLGAVDFHVAAINPRASPPR